MTRGPLRPRRKIAADEVREAYPAFLLVLRETVDAPEPRIVDQRPAGEVLNVGLDLKRDVVVFDRRELVGGLQRFDSAWPPVDHIVTGRNDGLVTRGAGAVVQLVQRVVL